MEFHHIPVLLDDVLSVLNPSPGDRYLDLTLGGAGHASAIAQRILPSGSLVGFDRDPDAQRAAQAKLALFDIPSTFIQESFLDMDVSLRQHGFQDREQGGGFDLILADFGLSSHQIDEPSRGFSFLTEAPLDMRMSQSGQTAAEFLQSTTPAALADILYQYSDIRQSRALARRICERAADGQLTTTTQLADVCCTILGYPRPGHPHPATRVFQAIRIAVNGELDALPPMLEAATEHLNPGGRLAVISFHSLEDRIIKKTMQELATGCTCPPNFPVCVCGKTPKMKLISRKPITPGDRELTENPRARSAKLRVAEKL